MAWNGKPPSGCVVVARSPSLVVVAAVDEGASDSPPEQAVSRSRTAMVARRISVNVRRCSSAHLTHPTCIVLVVKPEIRDMPERVTAMRRQVVHPHDIGMTIGRGSTELRAELISAGAKLVGPVYARYHSWTKDEADVEIGFEVESPVELEGVEMGVLSAGREAVATHQGAYKDIPGSFAALEAWVGDHAEIRGVPREVYSSDPDRTPMEDRITEIIFPIA